MVIINRNYKINWGRIMQNTQAKYPFKHQLKHQSTNSTFNYRIPPLKHFLTTLFTLLAFSITSIMNTAIAGGRTAEPNLMDSFLQKQSSQTQQLSTDTINNNALVFSRGDTGVDVAAFNDAFALDKTLTKIRNTSSETATDNSNAQLLGSLFNTLTTTSKANGFLNMSLQARNNEAGLDSSDLINNDGMLPTAVFNRFDLSASSGEHCGEYRIIYHKNTGAGRFFLIFEAQYPNPEPSKGSAGCYAVVDFWQKVGQKTKAQALVELEKFFYQGLEHEGVNLPAVVNFTHYTHETGQIRSNQFVDGPWQLREFKTDIDTNGKAILAADTVKDNPLKQLFDNEQNSESNELKALRTYFNNDFDNHYIDNLLTPEKHTNNPDASSIINGFGLGSDNHYNEFQSDSSSSDNTANPRNTTLGSAINNKLDELSLSSYTPQMIRNRAEAMSCSGCHQNSNGAEVAPNVNWPNSGFFVHVNERGSLSSALTEQFLPARAKLLKNYLQETQAQRCGPACQLGSASSIGGETHTCAIQSDNSVGCWGYNGYGQLNVPIGLIAKQIASGINHNCVLKPDNTVKCWGYGGYGQTNVPNDLIAKQIASGHFHSCALKLDNTVECWGRNNRGQATVPEGLTAKQISLGSNHSCALKFDNTVQCWGLNSNKQTDVPANLIAKQIALGSKHSCALKTDNTIECWGSDGYGQTFVPSNLLAKQVASSTYHSCAIKMDNSVECWGSPPTGSPMTNNLIAKQITLGRVHSCALKMDNSVECWGSNSRGQIMVLDDLIAKQL